MDYIISLAHFCEIHGPTSILCTQLLPVTCPTCYPHQSEGSASAPASPPTSPTPTTPPPLERIPSHPRSRTRPESAAHSRNPSFSRRNHTLLPPASQKSALQDVSLLDAAAQNAAVGVVLGGNGSSGTSYSSSMLSSPFRTPPGSPLSPGQSQTSESYLGLGEGRFGGRGAGAGESVSSETCANCSLSIPKSVSEQLPEGAPGSPSKDGKGNNGSPVLRTKELVSASSNLGDSPDEEDEDSTEEHATPTATRKETVKAKKASSKKRPSTKRTTSSTNSSSSSHSPSRTPTVTSSPPSNHTHTLTYLTTRLPPTPASHSLLRRSCIRALSCEHLPRANKGPLFFGDDQAGYTLAFVFRLADPGARGRSRRYAFICWAGRDERRAARAWKDVLGVFERCAAGIEALVEKRLDELAAKQEAADQERSAAIGRSLEKEKEGRDITPVSSFLSGRTVDPDGHPRRGDPQRARGLAELADREELFVELHAVFVRLLVKLGRGPTGSGALSSSSSSSVVGVEPNALGLAVVAPTSEQSADSLEQATSDLTLKPDGPSSGSSSTSKPQSASRKAPPSDTDLDTADLSPKSRPAPSASKSRRGSPSHNGSNNGSGSGTKRMEGLKGRLVAV